jgi:hypothetical protein
LVIKRAPTVAADAEGDMASFARECGFLSAAGKGYQTMPQNNPWTIAIATKLQGGR